MRFEYLEVTTLHEAISWLTKYGSKAKVLAGGTDLVIQMRRRIVKPEYIVNIGKLKGLDVIDYDDKTGLTMGALTTISSLSRSDILRQKYLAISEAAGKLASEGVRTIATLGGNLCNASPSADTSPILIALSAKAIIIGPKGEKQVLLEEFFTGPGKTILSKGELLTGVALPVMPPRTGAVYLNLGARGSMDLAIVGVATVITLEKDSDKVQDAKIVLGAVAPTAIRASRTEAQLIGKVCNEKEIAAAAQVASGAKLSSLQLCTVHVP